MFFLVSACKESTDGLSKMTSLEGNVSEDEALRRAMAESLVTARQDEERRQNFRKQEQALIEKYKRRSESPTLSSSQQGSVTVRRVTSLPNSGSLPDIKNIGLNCEGSKEGLQPENIVRPRPQPRQTSLRSRSPSPVFGRGLPPPRPDPPKNYTRDANKTGPTIPPRPANLPTRPSSMSGATNIPKSSQSSVPQASSAPDDIPLISLSPPRVSLTNCSDFDLSMFDPLNSTNNVTSGSTSAEQFTQAYDVSKNKSKPQTAYQVPTGSTANATGGLTRTNSQPNNMGTIFENQNPFDGLKSNGTGYKSINSTMFGQGATGPAVNMLNTAYRSPSPTPHDPFSGMRQPGSVPIMRPPQFLPPAPGMGSVGTGSHHYTPLIVGRQTPTQDMPDAGFCGASGSQMVVNLPPVSSASKLDGKSDTYFYTANSK